jgi:hypothetical protein
MSAKVNSGTANEIAGADTPGRIAFYMVAASFDFSRRRPWGNGRRAGGCFSTRITAAAADPIGQSRVRPTIKRSR